MKTKILKIIMFGIASFAPNADLNSVASGFSVFVHGDIIKDKLRFFARYDQYTPTNRVNHKVYNKYVLNTSNYNDNSYISIATAGAAAVATGDQTYRLLFFIPSGNNA